ncbi:hypothetical protein [Natrarchaeobius oligotrophus]|uniref:Uncharacterized protein n=1 Tax=Natrarchaeobius chitinivorans TaxID=1679083 RepID=A0A3N6PCW2_NATCH|nr:hypothetical protein [Natrarchaeobius chitinivorans]RQG97399.1 hypothetical protein EA472_19405 [Natrarchaeobius chitinivorans]
MMPVTRLRSRFAGRRTRRAFALLVAAPLGLVALESLAGDALPEAATAALELPYLLFVYLPGAVVGALVLEPLGVPDALAGVPLAAELTLGTVLVAFYYLLAVALVTLVSVARRIAGD